MTTQPADLALLELAGRVEQATGGDRALDAAIEWALFHDDPIDPPAYTASLDAAMTLASDPALKKFGGAPGMLREAADRLAKHFHLHTNFWPEDRPYAEWLARFVTAAALRARNHLQENSNG